MVDAGEAVEVGSPAGEEVDEVWQLGGDGDQSREFVADQTRGFGEAHARVGPDGRKDQPVLDHDGRHPRVQLDELSHGVVAAMVFQVVVRHEKTTRQSLNRSSICQRTRYSTTTSGHDSNSAGHEVKNTVQAQVARCRAVGCRPFLAAFS